MPSGTCLEMQDPNIKAAVTDAAKKEAMSAAKQQDPTMVANLAAAAGKKKSSSSLSTSLLEQPPEACADTVKEEWMDMQPVQETEKSHPVVIESVTYV